MLNWMFRFRKKSRHAIPLILLPSSWRLDQGYAMRGDQDSLGWPLYIMILYAVTVAVSYASAESYKCRCLDTNAACWPSKRELNEFNCSVGGRLITPNPTGRPCHDPHYNPSLCQSLRNNYFDAYLRADNAGSMQWENWEDKGQETCSMDAPVSSKCHQGQVPVLGVQVEKVDDIQKAIKFAARHNLRVAVKSSGHDFLGRSTAHGSFLIWMHKFKNISIHDSFVPSSRCGKHSTPAVTVVGGVGWGEVTDALKPTGYITVSGNARTVCATGGYIQGGGHGSLSPQFGLAVDSVLQIEVVTADGKLRTTNACKDPELFFALLGGGGGTYGVVTSVTYKLHRSPSNFAGFFYVFSPPNGTVWSTATQEEILTIWARSSIALDEAMWGGYWVFNAQQFTLVFLAPSKLAAAKKIFTPILEELLQGKKVTLQFQYAFASSTFQDWHKTVEAIVSPKTGTDPVGDRVLMSSRIIPLSAMKDPRGTAKAILSALPVRNESLTTLIGNVVIGPGVRAADPSGLTAVTPAWREGIWHLIATHTWSWNSTEGQKSTIRNDLKAFAQALHKTYPDSGAYTNEASIDEPQWQRSFWGLSNYGRLIATKQRVDPQGLFVCSQCVGSEFWDETGNCPRRY
ncbi:uncharacterized FAD-linked oxidoreductase ARB_02478 [Physcomitrium patens]|uniref:FAD-binding PCMH-type domain-containing protein n=1 Tax=Physcomitrium patens TaxID=3218 RepID=A0A2K1L057_PHYPA|nr:uncharacterized FAD-linked oxidoreductase ARB_02478-like [Physcomitrium patens]PNR59400.1 hypothetical protein PHYPA_002191 [Physcomitrium patens]|eukprot:XP_024359992.1 uncharacterized FAD-linked oxidoreductase ARB_02478-like [Physcomitrella patens]